MRKLSIAIIIIMTLCLVGVAEKNKLIVPPDDTPGWWYELNDDEQWGLFIELSVEYRNLNDIVNQQSESISNLESLLEESNDVLEEDKPILAGISGGIETLIDQTFNVNYIFSLYCQRHFYDGRFFIQPGLSILFFKNLIIMEKQGFGVGGQFICGFNFD